MFHKQFTFNQIIVHCICFLSLFVFQKYEYKAFAIVLIMNLKLIIEYFSKTFFHRLAGWLQDNYSVTCCLNKTAVLFDYLSCEFVKINCIHSNSFSTIFEVFII